MRVGTWALSVALIVAGCERGPVGAPARAPIIAGHLATRAEVGATVALVGPSDGYPFCTGTLVSPDVVLTAAHCLLGAPASAADDLGPPIAPSDVAVVVSATDAMTASDAQWYAARALHVHPLFLAGSASGDDVLTAEHDIGAVVLARRVDGVAPVPILAPDALAAELVPGRMLTAAGYGATDRAGVGENTELHVADVPFVRRSADELIAGVAGGSDTCYGDSGGPLYVDAHDGRRVVGVTSRGADASSDRCDGGTVFTIASAFVTWLEGVTGETFVEDAPPPPPPPVLVDAGVAPPVRRDAGAPVPPRPVSDSGVPPPRPAPEMRSRSGEVTGGCAATGRARGGTSTTGTWLLVAAVAAWAIRRRRACGEGRRK